MNCFGGEKRVRVIVNVVSKGDLDAANALELGGGEVPIVTKYISNKQISSVGETVKAGMYK